MSTSTRRAFRDKPPARPQVWGVLHEGAADRDNGFRPARVCHVLQVPRTGVPGLAAVSDAQHGLARRRQLLALGFGRGWISHRLETGWLYRVLPSVFAVGHSELQPGAMEMAALLSVGDDCVISHQSAAELWGIPAPPGDRVSLTLIGRHVQDRPEVAIHRVAMLDMRDVCVCQGLPATAPARTLLDLAGVSPLHDVERALAEARVQKLVTDRAIAQAMSRARGRRGTALLQYLLKDEPTLTRSEAERRLRRLILDGGLPPPETNARLLGFEVDFVWPGAKLVVEVDGHAFHAHRAAFERDRGRDQALVAAGYRVIRVTWRQLEREPLAVLARIAQALRP
jgi:very-short-patch-repair endonuclease